MAKEQTTWNLVINTTGGVNLDVLVGQLQTLEKLCPIIPTTPEPDRRDYALNCLSAALTHTMYAEQLARDKYITIE